MRLFLISPDSDFNDWIKEELRDVARFVKEIDSLQFFVPQWNMSPADIIVTIEDALTEDIFKAIEHANSTSKNKVNLILFYQREMDEFILRLVNEGCLCINYRELEPGLLPEWFENYSSKKTSVQTDISSNMEQEKEWPLNSELNGQESHSAYQNGHQMENLTEEQQATKEIKQKINPQNPHHAKLQEILRKYGVQIDQQEELLRAVEEIIDKQRKPPEIIRKIEKVIVEKRIEVEKYKVFPNRFVVIGSLSPSAGSTFVTFSLSRVLNYLGVPNAVVESPSNIPEHFHLLDGLRNAPNDYVFATEQIAKEGRYEKQGRDWLCELSSWYPLNPETRQSTEWKYEQTFRLFTSIKSPVVLYDVSHNWHHSSVEEICSDADDIIFVVDPFPARMGRYDTVKNIENLKRLRGMGKSVYLIGNRDVTSNLRKYKKEWISSLPEGIPICFHPEIPYQQVIEASWQGHLVQDDPEILLDLAISSYPLISRIVPPSFPLKPLQKKKFSIISKFMR